MRCKKHKRGKYMIAEKNKDEKKRDKPFLKKAECPQ